MRNISEDDYTKIKNKYKLKRARILVRDVFPMILIGFILLIGTGYLLMTNNLGYAWELLGEIVPHSIVIIFGFAFLIGALLIYMSVFEKVNRLSRKINMIELRKGYSISTEPIDEIRTHSAYRPGDNKRERRNSYVTIKTATHEAYPVERYSIKYRKGNLAYIIEFDDYDRVDALIC